MRVLCLAVAVLGLCATAAHSQPPPRAGVKVGPGSLSGLWVKSTQRFGEVSEEDMFDPRPGVMITADGTPLPVQPWAAKIVEQRLTAAEAGHPFATTKTRCLPPGIPDMLFNSGPIQILETPGQITILRQEFTFFRVIHMNRGHLNDPDPTFLGDSVGHWEGDTLVIDTIGIADKTTIKSVIPHSEDLHVIERIRADGPDALEISAVVEDAKTFTKTWTMKGRLRRMPAGSELIEYFCENNRNAPDASGNTTVQMPGR